MAGREVQHIPRYSMSIRTILSNPLKLCCVDFRALPSDYTLIYVKPPHTSHIITVFVVGRPSSSIRLRLFCRGWAGSPLKYTSPILQQWSSSMVETVVPSRNVTTRSRTLDLPYRIRYEEAMHVAAGGMLGAAILSGIAGLVRHCWS